MKKFRKLALTKFVSSITIVALLLVLVGPSVAQAASVTSFSVALSRQQAETVSNQTILFTTPTGVASGATILLTYDNSTAIPGAWDFEDADVSYDATPDGVCDTGDTHVVLADAASGATAGIIDTSATLITFTNGTDAIAAGAEICFEFGTNAEDVLIGVEQIENGSTDITTLTLSGSFGDSGVAAMSIIGDDTVDITATVAPTITFTISDTTIGFGALSASGTRWATGNASGAGSVTSAHDLTIATNSTGGYAVSYSGATLTSTTSSSDTVNVASSVTNTGTTGTEQFGLSVATSGDATITSAYAFAGTPTYTWVAGSTPVQIAAESGPSATETLSMYYLANISNTTEAGSYSTTATYIATGTF